MVMPLIVENCIVMLQLRWFSMQVGPSLFGDIWGYEW